MRGLRDKRYIVVGGAGGIGGATAMRLAEEGAKVFVADIAADGTQATVDRIRAAGGAAAGHVFDLGDADAIAAMVEACVTTFGGIDGVANIAVDVESSHKEVQQTIEDMDISLWERTFRVNTTGYALVIKAAIPHMRLAGGGAVVNTSSGAAYGGTPFSPAYSASKAGVHALTRHVAANFGKDGIRCNCVAPGFVLTASAELAMSKDARDAIAAGIPLRRLGDPTDLGNAICFLLSDDAQWISGQVLAVNGGNYFVN